MSKIQEKYDKHLVNPQRLDFEFLNTIKIIGVGNLIVLEGEPIDEME